MLRNPNYFMNNTSETLAVHVLKFIKLDQIWQTLPTLFGRIPLSGCAQKKREQKEHLANIALQKIGFDTAENEPSKVSNVW